MTIAVALLLMALILVWSDAAELALNTLNIEKKTAAAMLGLLMLGALLPPVKAGSVRLQLFPLLSAGSVCALLWSGEDSGRIGWGLLAGLAAGALATALSLFLPNLLEGEALPLEMVLAAVCGVAASLGSGGGRSGIAGAILGTACGDAALGAADFFRGNTPDWMIGHGSLMSQVAVAMIAAVFTGVVVGVTSVRKARSR